MKNKSFKKSVTILLLSVLISHLTFANQLISSYVICKGADGNIAVEKINDCKAVDYLSYSAGSTETCLSKTNCFNSPLKKNYFEADRYLAKSRITLVAQFVKISSISDNLFDTAEINNHLNNSELPNPNIKILSTVLLLI